MVDISHDTIQSDPIHRSAGLTPNAPGQVELVAVCRRNLGKAQAFAAEHGGGTGIWACACAHYSRATKCDCVHCAALRDEKVRRHAGLGTIRALI